MAHATRFHSLPIFKAILSGVLLTCAAFFIIGTIHWPMVGDASLMHYIVFLMERGMLPYRDIVDMNMPGSYLVEWVQMHVFGPGAMGLRLFDLALMGTATLAMLFIAWPQDWLAGIYASVLLLLIHGRDGVDQMAERDLTMTVLILVGYAVLFYAMREQSRLRQPENLHLRIENDGNSTTKFLWLVAVSGACIGVATTLKPTAAPLEIVLLACAAAQSQKYRQPLLPLIWSGLAGFAVPLAGVFYFLIREHAVQAFWHILIGLVPYHASIGHLPAQYFFLKSIRPAFLPIFLLCIGVIATRKNQQSRLQNTEGFALWLGVVFGIVSLIVQGKDYPYHLLPSEAFLLLLAGLNFTAALHHPGLQRVAGVLGLCFGSLILAPVATIGALHYGANNQEFFSLLQRDLQELPVPQLSGHVQCLDTTAGCINTLYQMQIVQSTGFLYDCYLFAPNPSPIQTALRRQFWDAIQNKPPSIFVVTNQLCVNNASDFNKLHLWPQFEQYLNANYVLAVQRTPSAAVRWWSNPRQPYSYRIYSRKPSVLQ